MEKRLCVSTRSPRASRPPVCNPLLNRVRSHHHHCGFPTHDSAAFLFFFLCVFSPIYTVILSPYSIPTNITLPMAPGLAAFNPTILLGGNVCGNKAGSRRLRQPCLHIKLSRVCEDCLPCLPSNRIQPESGDEDAAIITLHKFFFRAPGCHFLSASALI